MQIRNETLFTPLKLDSFQFVNVSQFVVSYSLDLLKTEKNRRRHLYAYRDRDNRELRPGDTGTIYFLLDMSRPGRITDGIVVKYNVREGCDEYRGRQVLRVNGRIR
jgi:hypothetical protein